MPDPLTDFGGRYPFELDEFQLEAIEALARGDSVLVAAPTGSGKTVVGEFAVWLAMQEDGKAFYTTPLKALSNQKFGDFIAKHGAEQVGLLTGDNVINSHAPVVVMTTEVLRNMIYERSELLRDLKYVVLDEVHYLQDPYRGAVWEEIIIHLPLDIRIVSLSATVSNAEEFADWIETVRGSTTTIIEHRRPVPLTHHYMLNNKLLPVFVRTNGENEPNPQISRIEAGWEQVRGRVQRHRDRGRKIRRPRPPHRSDVVELLNGEGILPAIYFIFSRKGCDAATSQCVRDGIDLTTPSEKTAIADYAEMRCSYLEDDDLEVLGYHQWVETLKAGIASHHAGLLPVFKETVEELFQGGLIKVVFATETLSLGINMPAKSVVIENLVKFTGERHELMTPGDFTQLTGRAGRRGIDRIGHAVVLEQREVPFRQIASLASTTMYPLLSSFQPSYNMATNLVRNYSREEAEHLLNSSFAQYRADKDVVVVEREIERYEAYLASYREKMACDLGDFGEYWSLTDQMERLEKSSVRLEVTSRRNQTRNALSTLRPGQVVIPGGRIRGPVVVIRPERSKRGEPRIVAVTQNKRLLRLTVSDFERPPKPVARIPIGKDGWKGTVDHETRRRLASALMEIEHDLPEEVGEDSLGLRADIGELRTQLHRHPCHRCPDREKHAQWAERASRADREAERLRKRVRSRTETLSRKFERVLSVLEEFDYVSGFELTDSGFALSQIYNENDLVVAECLTKGWLEGLDAAEIAAIASTFVFESRGPFEIHGRIPTQPSERTYRRILKLEALLKDIEKRTNLEMTRGTELGFAEVIYDWCQGSRLEDVLGDEMSVGDFIRSSKQTLDLLKQMRETRPDPEITDALSEAIEGVNRGVVAYTGIV